MNKVVIIKSAFIPPVDLGVRSQNISQIFCLELLDVIQSRYVLVFIFQNHPEKKTLGRISGRATNASESAV